MGLESMEGKGYRSIIANTTESALEDYIEEVELNVGGNTAYAGMILTYNGEVTAGTPGTHNHVDLATTNEGGIYDPFAFAGILLRPKVRPENYGLDDAITDATMVRMLKPTGGKAIIRAYYADNSDNVLPGQPLVLATGGKLKKMINSYAIYTTPVVAELRNAILQLSELVGVADAVAEDEGGTDIIVHMRY